MKRIISVVLAVWLLMLGSGFAEIVDYTSMSDKQIKEIIVSAPIELARRENRILFSDECGVTIYLTGECDFWDDPGMENLLLTVGIRNESDNSIYVFTEDVVVNGLSPEYNYAGIWDIKPNAVMEETLFIDLAGTSINKMDMIQDIAFHFEIRDEASDKVYGITDLIKLCFNGANIIVEYPVEDTELAGSVDLISESHEGNEISRIKEYKMNNGTFILRLDENNYNVFSDKNEEDSLSLSRTGFTKSQMDLYVGMSGQELFILPLGAENTKFSINVKVKENKYPEIGSFLSFSESEWSIQAKSLVMGFGESEYETVEKNNVRYCVFDCFSGLSYQRRYATIHNGSMIYIYASKDGEELRQEDIRLLEEIVNTAEYI